MADIDDITKLESILQKDGVIFLTYGGLLTQSIIAGLTEALEKDYENMDVSTKIVNNVLTIFIELSQNMMNYSKKMSEESFDPRGLILVGKDNDSYYILSQNIVNKKDKEKIEPVLKLIKEKTREEIKKLYKEARRSGRNTHSKGGGIGFFEIAKRCNEIKYNFFPIEGDENKFYFRFKAVINKI